MKQMILIILFVILISSLPARNPWLGRDKIAHFTASTFLTYWSFGVSNDFLQQNKLNSVILSANFSALLGVAKESSDKYLLRSDWSWQDIAYDIAGILAGLVLVNNLR